MEGIRRPPVQVLGDEALVPERNHAAPPERFTHRLTVAQNYYYSVPSQPREPDGTFAAGTQVLLRGDAGELFCWVVDEAGVLVVTARSGLRAQAER